MLRVCINAQLLGNGSSGGIEQVIVGLVHALGKLKDGEEEYILVTHPRNPYWLRPYMGDNMRIVSRPWRNWKERTRATVSSFGQVINPVAMAKSLVNPLLEQMRMRRKPRAVQSNGFWESLGVDVIHFPFQSYVVSQIPSIYNPHDLQHLHLPEFFTPSQIHFRETIYREGCRHAKAIGVASQWVKDDIILRYGTAPQKIFVIPWTASTEAYKYISEEKLSHTRRTFNLSQPFILYPAQTWPHKNHIRLIEAIALLRDKHNLRVNLICTGKKNDFWPTIRQRIRQLRLERQVRFLGFILPEELRALYRLSQAVIIPTLFEADSLPLLEAWREGTPVACSSVTSLPEQAGDAALLFEPTSVEKIAEVIYRMVTDSQLRKTLKQQGTDRVQLFSGERTAKMYRALYRKVAGHTITEEDSVFLEEAMSARTASGRKENKR